MNELDRGYRIWHTNFMFTVARYVIAKLLTVPKYVGLVEQRLCVYEPK